MSNQDKYATPGDIVNRLLCTLPLAFNSMDVDWEIRVKEELRQWRIQVRVYIPKNKPTEMVDFNHVSGGELKSDIPRLVEHLTKKLKIAVERRYVTQ